jgi:phage shock protein C
MAEPTHQPPAVGPAPEPPPGAERPRVLRRSRADRVLGGVAGGLGRYLGIDPVLLRIAFVLLVFAGGSGILMYLIGWIVIPEEKAGEALGPPPERTTSYGGSEAVGLLLVVVGAFFLLQLFVPFFDWRFVWPVLLIGLGLVLLLRGTQR